jgi:hypothetical protein
MKAKRKVAIWKMKLRRWKRRAIPVEKVKLKKKIKFKKK